MSKVKTRILSVIFSLILVATSFSAVPFMTKAEGGEEFAVHFDTAGGNEIEDQSIEVGSRAERPDDPVKEHFTFQGWYNGEEPWNFEDSVVMDETTLTAKWSFDGVTVTFEDGGDIAPALVMPGNPIERPDHPESREGYNFTGWYNGEELWDFDCAVMEDMVLTAGWEASTITAWLDLGDGYENSPVVLMYGQAPEIEDPVREGHAFAGWFTDETLTESFNTEEPLYSDITLYASWEEETETEDVDVENTEEYEEGAEGENAQAVTYAVSFIVDGEEYLSAEISENSLIEAPEDPEKEGFVFVRWETEGGTEWNFEETVVSSDVVLYAVFNEIYTVSFETYGAEEISDILVEEGCVIDRPEDPYLEGFAFVGWFTSEDFDVEWNFENGIEEDMTFYALFEEETELEEFGTGKFSGLSISGSKFSQNGLDSNLSLSLNGIEADGLNDLGSGMSLMSTGNRGLTAATLKTGSNFNTAIKKLVSSTTAYAQSDTTITEIRFVDTPFTSSTELQKSGESVYAQLNGTVVEIYSAADIIYANSDSSNMFYEYRSLTNIDLSLLNTDNVTNMKNMFRNCGSLTSLDVSNFNTSNVTDMRGMFFGCYALECLDLSSFDISNLASGKELVLPDFDAENLIKIKAPHTIREDQQIGPLPGSNNGMYDWYIDDDENEISDTPYEYIYMENGVTNQSHIYARGIDSIARTVTFYSKRTPSQYPGIYNGTIYEKQEHVVCNTTIMPPETNPVQEGKTFLGWVLCDRYINNLSNTFFDFSTPITEATYLFAIFGYTVTFDSQGGSMVPSTTGRDGGKISAPTDPVKDGYTFEGWYKEEECENTWNFEEDTVTDNITLYAKFDSSSSTSSTKLNYPISVNEAIKKLANPSALWTGKDETITEIRFVDTPFTSSTELQSPYGTYAPIYARLNGTVVELYTEADVIEVTGLSNLFYKFSSVESIDLSKFDTSNATDMSYMFETCSSLTSLDLSSFNTANVTNIHGMFDGCSSLTEVIIDFSANSITDMGYVFKDCSSLTELDLSSFDTSNATAMNSMFYNCSALTSLNISGFNTANVTNMRSMFYNCSALTSLNISSFNTANVSNMGMMFNGCSSLTSLNISNFNTANVTDMSHMFGNCSSLTELNLSGFNTANVTDMNAMFWRCLLLTSLNVSGFDTSNVTNMDSMFSSCSSFTSLDLSSFNTTNVTNMKNMFNNCSSLIELDLSNFDTSNVTSMSGMFASTGGIYADDNRDGVADKSGYSLANTPLSNSDIAHYYVKMTNKYYYVVDGSTYAYYSALPGSKAPQVVPDITGNYTFDGWYTSSSCTVEFDFDSTMPENKNVFLYGKKVFTGCTITYNTNGGSEIEPLHLDTPSQNIMPADPTKAGYVFEGWSSDEELAEDWDFDTIVDYDLTLYAKWGEIVVSYLKTGQQFNELLKKLVKSTYNYGSTVTEVKEIRFTNEPFISDCELQISGEPVYARYDSENNIIEIYSLADILYLNTDSSYMFYGFKKNIDMGFLDVSKFNTSNVTNMSRIFASTSFSSLDLSNFDTSKVTDMSRMFNGCSSLTSLNISSFNTSEVTNMGSMFYGCTSLTELDLSSFNTSNVIDMLHMFYDCNSLTSLDLSNFNTSNITDMSHMFYNCKALTSLDVSNFNTSKVLTMRSMFESCSKLTTLDLSNFDTSNVTNMDSMFSSCNSLTSLDLRNFNTSNVTYMFYMFKNCSKLTSLDVSNFNTSKVLTMRSMFESCRSLTTLDVSNFNTEIVSDMNSMFNGCSSLTSLNISSFNTLKTTDMSYMFEDCSKLTSLDVSNFNTSKVTGMSRMFESCSKLTTLNVSNFNTANVTGMGEMFRNCSKLTTLNVSNFNTANVTGMNGMFASCNSLTSLDLSNFNTEKVVTMSEMFSGCNNLTSLDVSSFNTEKVKYMYDMFAYCKKLTSLNLNGFNSPELLNMSGMFKNCSSLTGLDLSAFNAKKITTITDMSSDGTFRGCNNLYRLDLSGLDLTNAPNSQYGNFWLSKLNSLRILKTPTNLKFENPLVGTWYLDDNEDLVADSKKAITFIKTNIPMSHTYVRSDTEGFTVPDFPTTLNTGSAVNGVLSEFEDIKDIKWAENEWDDIEESPNIAQDGEIPVYARRVARYEFISIPNGEEKYVHTSNINDAGIRNGNYDNNANINTTVSFPGAEALHVRLTYTTETNYDFVYVFSGEYTGTINLKNKNPMPDGFVQKYCGSQNTVEFDITGDTATFVFQSDSSTNSYYGYYAVVTPETIETHYICELYTDADIVKFNEDSSFMFKDLPVKSLSFLGNSDIIDMSLITDADSMFEGCENLESVDLNALTITNSVSTQDIFKDCDSLETIDIGPNTSSSDIPLPRRFAFDDDKNDEPDSNVRYAKFAVSDEAHRYIKADVVRFTVSFDTNEGSTIDTITAEYGTTISAPEDPTKENYLFLNWYKDEDLTDIWDFDNDTVTEDTTLYAKWGSLIYHLTVPDEITIDDVSFYMDFECDDEDFVNEVEVDFGDAIVTLPNSGYRISLYENEDLTVPVTVLTFTSSESRRVYVKKEEISDVHRIGTETGTFNFGISARY